MTGKKRVTTLEDTLRHVLDIIATAPGGIVNGDEIRLPIISEKQLAYWHRVLRGEES